MMFNQLEEYIKSLDNLNQSELDCIKKGYFSYWNLKYGLNIDKTDTRYCFRSDYNLNYTECEIEKDIIRSTETIFYEKVKNDDLDYKDIEKYKEIFKQQREKHPKCNECKTVRYTTNENEIYVDKPCVCARYSINDKKNMIIASKIILNGSIKKIAEILFVQVKNALNNNISMFNSYSKALAAPLFKYSSLNKLLDDILSVKCLNTNTMDVAITVNCFNWYDTLDEFGNEEDRFPVFSEIKTIPLRCIGSDEAYIRELFEDIYSEQPYRDIDSVEVQVKEVTIDVSALNRNNLNECLLSTFNDLISRYASFKKDLEVLTTEEADCSIKDPKCVQLIRFIYLLKITNSFTDKDKKFIEEIYDGKYADKLSIDSDNQKAFLIIWSYLSDEKNVYFEQINYDNLFKDNEKYRYLHINTYTRQGICSFLNSLIKMGNNNLFDQDLLQWFLNNSSLV